MPVLAQRRRMGGGSRSAKRRRLRRVARLSEPRPLRSHRTNSRCQGCRRRAWIYIIKVSMADLFEHGRDSGFPFPGHLVHLFVGGSELHGAKVHGTDDLDIYGVYIEPPEMVLGLESLAHFVWSTAGNGRRNGPNDVDVTLYSLKKWAGLASKGNHTALHFLSAQTPVRNPIWMEIGRNRIVFLARTYVKPFVGFADDQLKRMTGSKGRGKKGQRPEIEEKYGYDVKAGMHTLRLLYECKELLSDSTITMPRP